MMRVRCAAERLRCRRVSLLANNNSLGNHAPRECSSTKRFETGTEPSRFRPKCEIIIFGFAERRKKTNYPGNCLVGRLEYQSVPRSLVG